MSTRVGSQPGWAVLGRSFAPSVRKVFGADLNGFHAPFSERRFALVVMDVCIVFVAAALAMLLMPAAHGVSISYEIFTQSWYWFLILAGTWVFFAWLNDLYDIPSSHDLNLTARRLLANSAMGIGVFLFIWMMPGVKFDLALVALFWIFASVSIMGWRFSYVTVSKLLLPFQQRVLIIGSGERGKIIAQVLQDASHLNYKVLGYVEDGISNETGFHNFPILGETEALQTIVKENRAQHVVVATEGNIDERLFHALIDCQGNGIPVSWMPDLYEKLCYRIPIQHIDPSWGLYAMQDKPVFRRLHLSSKRLLDLALFVFALPVFIMIFPLLALAIRLDSKGPIFYKQIRCGRGGRPFNIFKFRTMRTDAEKDGQARWARKNDSRITYVGKFLRKTRLDELPQILNVLRGDMSFVGPRPERPEFIENLKDEIPFFSTRMLVKPGLTGWAQIHYDYGNTVDDARMKLQYDFYYVRYWSWWMDIYILFRTIAVVFKMKGT